MAALKLTDRLSAQQAVQLLFHMSKFASTDLVECFDRIIGYNLDKLDPSDVLNAFIGF